MDTVFVATRMDAENDGHVTVVGVCTTVEAAIAAVRTNIETLGAEDDLDLDLAHTWDKGTTLPLSVQAHGGLTVWQIVDWQIV